MQSRYKRKVLVATAVVLGAAGLGWYLVPSPLSPTEQSLVGVWIEPRTQFLLEFRDDRTCIQRPADGSEIGPSLYALGGKWRVEKEVLICWWGSRREIVVPVRVISSGTKIGNVQLPTLRWLEPMKVQLLRVADNEVTVMWPSLRVDFLKRYPE